MPKGNGDLCASNEGNWTAFVRNTVNAERQWRQGKLSFTVGSNTCQEHGECRKAMETPSAGWSPLS